MKLSLRACLIKAGKFGTDKDFDGFGGVDDLVDALSLIVFYNDEEEAIGYAVFGKEGQLTVDNCAPGDIDSEFIRASLPNVLNGNWNTVLLASTDIDEIDEEGLEYILLYPDDAAEDAARPFNIGDEFSSFEETQKHIVVHKVFGAFGFSGGVDKSFPLEQFLGGELEEPIKIEALDLGEVEDFESDTETLCLVYLD